MAALSSYVKRMPMMYQHRYRSKQWVDWANDLLERLSGEGCLPPQLLTRGAIVRNGVWIDRPPMSRDIKVIRHAKQQETVYRFAEENNRLRLIDAVFNKPQQQAYPVVEADPSGIILDVAGAKLEDGYLDDWLFVATEGEAAGHTFIVSESFAEKDDRFTALFLHSSPSAAEAHDQSQSTVDEEPFISAGYFIGPNDYLILFFTAKFRPVLSMSDDLGIDGYGNLVNAWLRWKVEERVLVTSSECAYWHGRAETEFSNLRAELLNRINKPRGRALAGFIQ